MVKSEKILLIHWIQDKAITDFLWANLKETSPKP